jgi:hypothetical protein
VLGAAAQGRDHVVLEQTTRVGSAWRDGRWDSFTLVTPNWTVRLPGFPYRGDDPDGFMTRAEVVSHLEQYVSSFGAPMCYGQRVTAVDPSPDGKGYFVSTADGADFTAANVVVATGSFQFPRHRYRHPRSARPAARRHALGRQTDFAGSTTNSATSSAADPVTTNTFQRSADAVTFSITPASQWASCKSDNQKIRPRDALQTARDVTEPDRRSGRRLSA